MRKTLRAILTLAATGAVIAQFVPVERANPPLDPARRIEAQVKVPDEARSILRRACYDCHSNETKWPLYSRVAPASWLMASHVRAGRHEMNFSDWQAGEKLGEVCEEVSEGKMPLPSYRLLHNEARLSQKDVGTLCTWAKSSAPKAVAK